MAAAAPYTVHQEEPRIEEGKEGDGEGIEVIDLISECTDAKDIFPEMVGSTKAITASFHYFNFGLIIDRTHNTFVQYRSMVMTTTRRDLDAAIFTMIIMYLISLFLQSWDQSFQN
jgi:hypothetical protein